jgi:2,4-dienoyl-CoA reductase (NADPH2)
VQELAIPVMTSTRVEAIGDDGVTIVDAKNERSFLAADSVIAAVAARPNQELFHELEWMVDEIHGCGDALVPLGLTRAIYDGYRLGARL